MANALSVSNLPAVPSTGVLSHLLPGADLALLRRERIERPLLMVGTGTCGLGAGAGATLAAIRAGLAERGLDADLVEVGCIGLCAEEPIVEAQLPGRERVAFGRVRAAVVPALLEAVLDRGDCADPSLSDHLLGQHGPHGAEAWTGVPALAEHPFFLHQARRVLVNCGLVSPISLDEYLSRGGYAALAATLTQSSPAAVRETVECSGLRGRGGGGFPTGTKWKLAAQQADTTRFLVCNADEGDPGAFMDRAIIEGDPHRLIEGMAIAAFGIGAQRGVIYIRAEYPLAIARLERAIRDARKRGLLGESILESGFSFDLEMRQGAGAFVCGEETALLHSVEGKRGMPRTRPPYPAASGLGGHPTIINNVETLANLPAILAEGDQVFADMGVGKSRGTKVFALSGKVARTGLVEVEMGTSLERIVFDIGGGVPDDKAFKAVQIGGPSGGCIPRDELDLSVDYETLRGFGAMMGSGGLVVLDEDNCMVDVARYFMEFIQEESCGNCIPCREGTARMLDILDAITRGRGHESGNDALSRFRGVIALEELGEVIRDTSLCGLGQSAPNPVLSTLRWFRHEYEAHVFERSCPAGACQRLLTFTIIEDACTGCTACVRKCPTNAIKGRRKAPHYIVADACIGCGVCQTTCRFDAIEVR
jgi:NADH:ubiquinone oxidoreductase subunit F (NADH-binding)/Pyruvate/2-oxoacid:ferredoxin oxidoreductase delta subunit/(2Fe-2S) ferredoxin